MSDPLVTCLCLTYGRPHLLGEAVKCFIDQDYPNKELIILNDQEGVELCLENCPDNIKIINYPKRFNSLGEKRNYSKTLGNGDYYAIWDDDDLYTPFRLSESIKGMIEYRGYDIIKAKDAVISVDNSNYKIANNLFHSQALITKNYMTRRFYPSISIGEDRDFEKNAKIFSLNIFPFFFYVYRWGLATHHVSGNPNEKLSWEKSLKFEPYTRIKGKVFIKPEFQKDYWEDIKNYMNKINPNLGKIWYEKIGRKL